MEVLKNLTDQLQSVKELSKGLDETDVRIELFLLNKHGYVLSNRDKYRLSQKGKHLKNERTEANTNNTLSDA